MFYSFTSLLNSLLFYSLDTVLNEIVFPTSFLDSSLLVYRNASDFYMLILYVCWNFAVFIFEREAERKGDRDSKQTLHY